MRTSMRVLLAAPLLAAGLSVAAAPAAQAQWRHAGGYGWHRPAPGGYGAYRHGHGPGLAGALVGGLAAGAVLGVLGAGFAAPPPVVYAPPPVIYAEPPPPVVYAAPPPAPYPGYPGYGG